jgi:hypothetical protein
MTDDTSYEPLLKHGSMASEEGEFEGRKQSRSSSLSQAIGSSVVPTTNPGEEVTEKKPKFVISEIPWVAMFTHPASLCLFLLNWVFGWIGFMLLTEMPSFLNDQLGYDLESSGLLSIAPYAANLLSVAMFAQIYDHLEVPNHSPLVDLTLHRKRKDGLLARSVKMQIKLRSLDQVPLSSSVAS